MNIPNRPGCLIRAPVRNSVDKTNMDSSLGSGISDRVMTRVQESANNKPEFIIYTNTGVCPYSDDLVNLAHTRGLNIQRIDVSQKTPPSWLPGTPSVVCRGNVYCGDAAFDFIESIEHDVQNTDTTNDTNNSLTLGSVKEKPTGGCGISAAFAPPVQISVDESQFSMKTDEVMAAYEARRRSATGGPSAASQRL